MVTVMSFVACKKNDSNDSAQTPAYQLQGVYPNQTCVNQQGQVVPMSYCTNANGGYYMSGGYCYSPQGQIVANTLCTNTGTGGYYYSNGYCYSPQGQIVSNTLCTNTGTGGYYFSNGYCYSPQGQIVSNTLCTNTGGGVYGQQCVGTYLYQSGYWTQMVYCSGMNCRGYTLTEVSTNRIVNCQ